jgi:hypothetical protein
MPLGPEYKKYVGRQAPNPSDPFGNLARHRAAEAAKPLQPKVALVPANAVERPVAPALKVAPRPLVVDTAVDRFDVAVFSSGALQITVGDKSLSLTPDQQRQLRDFMRRCGLIELVQAVCGSAKAARGLPRRVCRSCKARRSQAHFNDNSSYCHECEGQ